MDTALKQRLIGAVVLVALAVIFLPMLVKGPAPDSGVSDIPLNVPDAPAGQYETRELPLVAPGDAPSNGAVGLVSTPATSPDAAAPATSVALPAVTAGGNYAVNFGAYATAKDADAVIARLRQANLPGYTEPTTINGKPAFRVRIGPYSDQASAESIRLEAVKVRGDVKAQVVVLDAAISDAAAPATAATTAPASTSVPQPATTAATVTTRTLPPEPARPATSPATAPPKPAAVVPAKPSTTTAATPAASKPATTTPATPPPPAAAKPAATTATAPAKPAAAGVGFAVQLGAFASAADANALRDRVRGGGFSAFVEQVRTDKGTLNRVRVGPVASREAADQLKAQIANKYGISGMVRPHP